jgi:hypothetical protein
MEAMGMRWFQLNDVAEDRRVVPVNVRSLRLWNSAVKATRCCGAGSQFFLLLHLSDRQVNCPATSPSLVASDTLLPHALRIC